uniref:Uncharacterized protein n=1 Tax=Elaeophora elaphi TaxID=1147741 RepID=A0A0R3RV90_9BILA
MGNRNAKNTEKNQDSQCDELSDRQADDQTEQITLLRSISTYFHFSATAIPATEKRNRSGWLTSSHLSLPHEPSINSTASSVSITETIPFRRGVTNSSATCMVSRADENIKITSGLAKRSYTNEEGFLKSYEYFTAYRKSFFKLPKQKEYQLQNDNEISTMKMPSKNPPSALLTPKLMNKRKSLSTSWLTDGQKGTILNLSF